MGCGPSARGALTARHAAGAPGDPGLYGPSSEAWRLNREAFLLLGAGPRALLLQVAHPLIAEGVDQHSDFQADPWARLEGTIRSFLTIVYGGTAEARAEIRRLNALHRSVTGPVRDPRARARFGHEYEARDPELSMWVHATLVESTIAVYDAWVEPLSVDRRARFYAETRPIARAFGIPDAILPGDLDAFDAYYEAMLAPGGPVHPTPFARELARTILHPSLVPLAALAPRPSGPFIGALLRRVPPWVYDWTVWPSVGLLPARLREEYGLRWGRLEAVVATWLVAGWRVWRPFVPKALRWMPHALAADARAGAVRGR